MAHARALLLVLLGALVLASCSDGGPPPEDTADTPPATVRPYREPEFVDTRAVTLGGVQGGPGEPDPIPVWGGEATLGGVLQGPDGPVVGGRVRLERFVGQVSTSVEVTTNEDGEWRARNIHGGRYRVRGWRIPDLAMNESVLLFLGGSEERTLDLAPTEQGGVDIQAVLLSDNPVIDTPVTLTALVTRHRVDVNGVVEAEPLAGTPVRLTSSSGWDGIGDDQHVDGEGRVDWALTCTQPDPAPLRITAGDESFTVAPPRCQSPSGPVTPPDDGTDEPQTNFPVGSSFTPPFAGPVPPGTYEVTDSSGACALVYETWDGEAWSTDRVTNTSTSGLVLDTFARNLETLGDTPACTYRRAS